MALKSWVDNWKAAGISWNTIIFNLLMTVCGNTQNQTKPKLFPIQNFYDTESDTFFDTKFVHYRIQNYTKNRRKKLETEKFPNWNVTLCLMIKLKLPDVDYDNFDDGDFVDDVDTWSGTLTLPGISPSVKSSSGLRTSTNTTSQGTNHDSTIIKIPLFIIMMLLVMMTMQVCEVIEQYHFVKLSWCWQDDHGEHESWWFAKQQTKPL